MSAQAPAPDSGPGPVQAVTAITDKLIGTLPPAFVALLVVNALFLGLVMWFLAAETGQRAAIVNRIIDGCSHALLYTQPPPVPQR